MFMKYLLFPFVKDRREVPPMQRISRQLRRLRTFPSSSIDIPLGASTILVLLSNISSPNRKCKGVDVHASPIRASVLDLSMQATQGTFYRYARRSNNPARDASAAGQAKVFTCVGNYPTLAPNCCQALYANKVDSYYRNVSDIVARR